MNVYDIAKKAGVSIATVSRVINHPDAVSPVTADKVRAAIEECNYTPSSLARALGNGKTRIIGVVCTDISDMYCASAVSVLENELRKANYDMLVIGTGYDVQDKTNAIQVLLSKGVEAIFLIGAVLNENIDNTYIEAAAKKTPIFVIDGETDMEGVYCFLTNEEDAIAHALTRLSIRGRKNAVYLYDSDTPSCDKKLNGYRKGLQTARMTPNILKVEKTAASVASALSELIVLGVPFDAIIASEDFLAVAAINTLIRHGISVPQEVAVIGMNNLPVTEYCQPTLTSIDIQLKPLCETAVKTLIDLFNKKVVKSKTILPSELVYRESFTI